MKTKKRTIITVLAIAMVCSFAISQVNAKRKSDQEVNLGDTEVVSALVVGIDKKDKTLTLIGTEGNVAHFEVGDQVRNFDQIEVGDHVKIEYHGSVALYFGEHGTQPENDAGLVVARAPKGAKPGGIAVGAIDVSVMVEKIDKDERTVTLKGHDGHSTTVNVDKSIKEFKDLEVGDLIHARFTEAIAVSVQKTKPDHSAIDGSAVTLLFVQNADGFSYDKRKKTITLEGVNPSVTFFSDRPYRIAGHILVPGFIQLWDEGGDSFKDDPPNANISILEDGQVKSAVVEIADPQFKNNQLTYKVVKVLDGDMPASGGTCSLFIDGLFDGGAGAGAFKGAAGGALIGAISGNAGRGAAIGAGVGLIGGGIREGQQREAAAQAQADMQARSRVVYIPNPNGSSTPVTLLLVQNGWQGPRGEIYPTLPTAGQLQGTYGIR
jgi:hypothetical protein